MLPYALNEVTWEAVVRGSVMDQRLYCTLSNMPGRQFCRMDDLIVDRALAKSRIVRVSAAAELLDLNRFRQ